MSKKFFSQLAVALSGAAVIAAGTTLPAIADPASVTKYGELVGMGSDTTMDVMDGIAKALETATPTNASSLQKIASYKAIGSADVAVDASGISIPRFNGSSSGRDALLIALGQKTDTSLAISSDEFGVARSAAATTNALNGRLHFARSSDGPGSTNASGVITYVPFAIDSLTYAVSANSKIPADIPLGSAAETETLSLTNIYKKIFTKVIVDATTGEYIKIEKENYIPVDGVEIAHTINAYIPQAGSGTRKFWISKVGISETDITNGNTAAKATTPSGLSVQEHDGSALANDPYALVGFSISQWVAQTNRVALNRLSGAVLRSIGGVPPTTGSGTSYETNPAWTAIQRTVYNIVPTALVNATTENAITRAFRGTDSLVCQAKDVITKYGYGLLSYPTAPLEAADAVAGRTVGGNATVCGNITSVNRTNAPSVSTVELADPLKNTAGNSAVIKATVTSNGNQGGTVTLYSDYLGANEEPVASGIVAKGATFVDITVANTTSSAYAKNLKAEFIPALSGIAASNSGITALALSLTAATPPPVEKTATGVSLAATVATNGLTATINATVTGGQAGTLNLYNTEFTGTPMKTVDVSATGRASVTVDQAKGEAVTYNLRGEFVPTNTAVANSSRTSAALTVVLKNTSYKLITVAKSYTTKVAPSVSVTIKAGKSTSTVGATGTVFAVVYNSKNVPVQMSSSLVKLVAGKATLTLAKIATVGTYTVKVFYGGSSAVADSTTALSFKVTK